MPPYTYTPTDLLYPRIQVFDAWLQDWCAAIERGEIILPASDGSPDTITDPNLAQAAEARPAPSPLLDSGARR